MERAFLNVETSITGRRWTGPGAGLDRAALALGQQTGLADAICRTLARLNVAPEDAQGYLEPKLRDLLPDPRRLRDCEVAAARLLDAAAGGERIAIFADYDVDGGASAALILDWLHGHGATAMLYVPDRLEEGYGPNAPAMARLAADHDLIVCVDCGTVSVGPIAAAAGADVVVIDHHLGDGALPDALAVVNPNRLDEDGTLGHLCAAAVVFLVLVEANRQARARALPRPDPMAMLDLVALATVADVAQLTGVNRAFVRAGLQVMARRARPGLRALSDAAGLDRRPEAHHLGFLLGPRINAGGRIGRADLGARLLSTRDAHEADALAARLETLNTERRETEGRVRREAIAGAVEDGPLVWAAGDGWHPGVVGIVASRLKERFGRPAVVLGLNGDEAKGSGRGVTGVDLGTSVQRLAAEGLIARGGGHRMAAGLSMSRDQVGPAMARLAALLAAQGVGGAGVRELALDGVLDARAATRELVETLDRCGPFGAGAPAPRFALPGLTLRHAREVGQGHLKLSLGAQGGGRLEAIAFGAFDGPLGPALVAAQGRRVHLAGRIETNAWQGRVTVQIRAEDAAFDEG
ncbi:MAG: single-stranded-DNA-specific exonuclease RecJ [Paracoccaceae bacterium]